MGFYVKLFEKSNLLGGGGGGRIPLHHKENARVFSVFSHK